MPWRWMPGAGTACLTRHRSPVITAGNRERRSLRVGHVILRRGSLMIHVDNLHKSFKTKTGVVNAVDGIGFTAPDGQITGLLGPNGAGKTTCLRMLSTLMTPELGRASFRERMCP